MGKNSHGSIYSILQINDSQFLGCRCVWHLGFWAFWVGRNCAGNRGTICDRGILGLCHRCWNKFLNGSYSLALGNCRFVSLSPWCASCCQSARLFPNRALGTFLSCWAGGFCFLCWYLKCLFDRLMHSCARPCLFLALWVPSKVLLGLHQGLPRVGQAPSQIRTQLASVGLQVPADLTSV